MIPAVRIPEIMDGLPGACPPASFLLSRTGGAAFGLLIKEESFVNRLSEFGQVVSFSD